jgi:CheY-like chemotaxis protein
MLRRVLTQLLGYRVIQAVDGRQGLDLVRQSLPNLILCDLEMPELNGYEVLAALRSEQGKLLGLDTIPFVLLSGSCHDRSNTEIVVGATDTSKQPDFYLTKPFELEDLTQVVRHCLVS